MKIGSINQCYSNMRLPQRVQKVSNVEAEKLLKKELAEKLPDETKVDYYIARLKGICENLEVQSKELPISKENPDKLNPEKNKELCSALHKVNILA